MNILIVVAIIIVNIDRLRILRGAKATFHNQGHQSPSHLVIGWNDKSNLQNWPGFLSVQN